MPGLKEIISKNRILKSTVHRMIMPKNQARPRFWIKAVVNPLVHRRQKGSLIRKRTRKDLFPFNKFEIGKNSTIEDFTTLNNGVGDIKIGNGSRVGIGNVLIGPLIIGNDVITAQNVVISGLNHNYQDIKLPIRKQNVSVSEVVIEDESWIGANSVITPGVTIGKHSVVAAGSVVTKSIPRYSVAAGNPARVIKKYNIETNKWEKYESISK